MHVVEFRKAAMERNVPELSQGFKKRTQARAVKEKTSRTEEYLSVVKR